MSGESWGRYPKSTGKLLKLENNNIDSFLTDAEMLIAYGNGRSYGDSALHHQMLHTIKHNLFISFDQETGILCCQSGVLLSDILDVFVNRGWFLPVTPGTKYITVGGAISSDVHGKNQHLVGSFSEFVYSFRLALFNGDILECSRESNLELFKAVCGGMGLMGVILDACIQLKPISSSYINQKTIKTKSLDETLEAFQTNQDYSYSVAWIDCMSKTSLGRAVLTLGEHSSQGGLNWQQSRQFSLPNFLSKGILNRSTNLIFNNIYYHLNKSNEFQAIDLNRFFYPLDRLSNWNRLYGNSGFIQYQFVIPIDAVKGLYKIISTIADYGQGAHLAVLKLFGKGNDNYLSFPTEGYTLAVDFKVKQGLFECLNLLDDILLDYGGRIYLAKDCRMSRNTFDKGYPKADLFRELRRKYQSVNKFQSMQSKRLGL